MFLIGLILAIIVGITLGLVGSGGSILTVPIFVYIFNIDPVLATAYSLFAIGTTSLIGGVRGVYKGDVDFDKLIRFGIPSMVTVFVTRKFIVPLIPDQIHILGYTFSQDVLLMISFSILMLISAYAMFYEITLPVEYFNVFLVSLLGIVVGGITGIVGAGGGFLIIPALTNLFNLSMKRAVSTSLVLICINSLLGLVGDWRRIDLFDWNLLLLYTFMTVVGVLIGIFLSYKIDGKYLKRFFATTVMCVAIFVLLREFGII